MVNQALVILGDGISGMLGGVRGGSRGLRHGAKGLLVHTTARWFRSRIKCNSCVLSPTNRIKNEFDAGRAHIVWAADLKTLLSSVPSPVSST